MTTAPVDQGMLPQNIEAEQAVLGSILIDQNAMEALQTALYPQDFYLPVNSEIYRAMVELHQEGHPPDIIHVSDWLEAHNRIDDTGGVAYLAALCNTVPTSTNIEHYAEIVANHAELRRLVDAGTRIAALGYDDRLAGAAALQQAHTWLDTIERHGTLQTWEPKADSLDRLYDRLTGPAEQDESSVLTGLKQVDYLLGGFRRGELIIIGARPGIGKTSLCTSLAHTISIKRGQPVLFFSVEMIRDQIWEKMWCLQTDLSFSRLTGHSLDPAHLLALREARERTKAAPFDVVPAQEWTVTQIRAAARRFQSDLGDPLAMIVVDYLQLIRPEGRADNREQAVAAITLGLKEMAAELSVPVIAASQLNREPEGRAKGEPTMSELRESGSQEAAAAVVILLSPHPKDKLATMPVARVRTQIAKNRLGRKGRFDLGFRGAQMEFVDNPFPEEMEDERPWPARNAFKEQGDDNGFPF